MMLADDNTLWIGMTKCTNGERYATGPAIRLPDHVNTTNNSVTLLEPYLGDVTGIAAVTGLHKIYVAAGRTGVHLSTPPTVRRSTTST